MLGNCQQRNLPLCMRFNHKQREMKLILHLFSTLLIPLLIIINGHEHMVRKPCAAHWGNQNKNRHLSRVIIRRAPQRSFHILLQEHAMAIPCYTMLRECWYVMTRFRCLHYALKSCSCKVHCGHFHPIACFLVAVSHNRCLFHSHCVCNSFCSTHRWLLVLIRYRVHISQVSCMFAVIDYVQQPTDQFEMFVQRFMTAV